MLLLRWTAAAFVINIVCHCVHRLMAASNRKSHEQKKLCVYMYIYNIIR